MIQSQLFWNKNNAIMFGKNDFYDLFAYIMLSFSREEATILSRNLVKGLGNLNGFKEVIK